MFGYVRPYVPELKVMDNELYRATYCGLCRTMGKKTGCISKFALNYDFVFLALLRMAAEGESVDIKMRRCLVHPFKKRPMLEINDSLEYSAQATTMLTRLKLKDNINDSHGISKIKAKIVGAVSVFFKKTDKSLLPLQEKIIASINKLTELEGAQTDSIDEVACTFGELLGSIASNGIEGGTGRILYDVGFHLGKLIYVLDAVDDFKDDLKTGSFNVIKNAFGNELTDEAKQILKTAMTLELEKMSKGIELFDFSSSCDVERIVKNITYIGLPKEIERVILGKEKKKAF